MTDKEKIREVVKKRYEYWREKESNSHSIESEIRMSECQHLLLMLDSLQEEPVNEELEQAVKRILNGYACMGTFQDGKMYTEECMLSICKAGANWQKQQMIKSAIGGCIYQQIGDECKAISLRFKDSTLKCGDKVKLIVIK